MIFSETGFHDHAFGRSSRRRSPEPAWRLASSPSNEPADYWQVVILTKVHIFHVRPPSAAVIETSTVARSTLWLHNAPNPTVADSTVRR